MMKRNKILIRINNLNEINEYKKLDITNFLFALKDYSIGYPTFEIDQLYKLDINVFILVNRVLNNQDIDNFKLIIPKLNFIKGLIFEDLGVYQLLKDSNIPLIWNQNHFAVNSKSINIWLDKVNSLIISNELEKSELINIINNVNKPVILPVLGLNMAMYSRRYLLSYFNEYKSLNRINNAYIENNNINFKIIENNYGTVLFYNKYYNLTNEIENFNEENILYYYIDPIDLELSDITNLLINKTFNKNIDNRFYEKKTVYRIGDVKND